MQKLDVLVKITENGVGLDLPCHATDHSAGLDLRAAIPEGEVWMLNQGDRKVIPCGFIIELPAGYEAQVRARSGLALKHGICLANGVGTIDADFRGEVAAILQNRGEQMFVVQRGDRIAQMVIAEYQPVVLVPAEALTESERGDGGYGSTGTG